MQRIMIKGRVFQQPTSEPLGDDWGQELRMLTRVRQTSATAIKQVVTNADDTTAATRADLNYVDRTVADLPEGEEKQALCQAVKDLRSKAEEMRQAARLEPTKVRAGKQARRKQGRNEQDRLTRALLTRKHKSSLPLAQQTAASERSDPLPTLRQKDKSAMKVRGWEVEWRQHRGCGGGPALVQTCCILACPCRCVVPRCLVIEMVPHSATTARIIGCRRSAAQRRQWGRRCSGGHSCASEATIQRSLKRRHLLGRLLQSWRLSKHSRLQVCGVVRAPAHFTSPSTHLVTFWEACTQGERVKEAGPTITPCWDAQVRAIGAGGTIKTRGNVCRPRERAGGMWKRRAQGSAIANCLCEPLGRPTERRMNPL